MLDGISIFCLASFAAGFADILTAGIAIIAASDIIIAILFIVLSVKFL